MLIQLITNLSHAATLGLIMHNAGAQEVLRTITQYQRDFIENTKR